MNNRSLIVKTALIALLLSLSCAIYIFLVIRSDGYIFLFNPLAEKQHLLAKELGVKIEDYPPHEDFPVSYFLSKLTPGMNIKEVHSLIKGYQKVYYCEKSSEIYYFYSEVDNSALRMKIKYDSLLKYKSYETEDPDSRTIQLFGCLPGLIK